MISQRSILSSGNDVPRRVAPSRNERGVALLIALLLVMLVSALSIGMYIAMSSDSMINGFYRNQRSSYYAADTGIAIGRQYLMNQIVANENTGSFSAGTAPLPTTVPGTVLAALTSQFGSSYSSINTGNAASSWAGQFKIDTANTTFAAAAGSPSTTTNALGAVTGYVYTYAYQVQAIGQSRGTEQTTLRETGNITVNATLVPGGTSSSSFAAFGLFIDQWNLCTPGGSSTNPLAPGLFSGPTFTNGSWNFGSFSSNYTFMNQLAESGAQFGYMYPNGGGYQCFNSSNPSYTSGGTKIAPIYDSGYALNQPVKTLPTNTYGQESAVLDGTGATCNMTTDVETPEGAPTQAQMAAELQTVNGTAPPSSGTTPTGVYLPYYTNPTTHQLTLGSYNSSTGIASSAGGIFVQGNTGNMTLSATKDTAGNPTQTYTIVQGSTTTTVVVDNTMNTTSISSGGTAKTLAGVPTQVNPCTGGTQPATMLYVNGNIGSGTGGSTTGLSGPYSGSTAGTAVQNGTDLTVTASGNVQISGDIKYAEEPVQTSGSSIDSLISYSTGAGPGVLGIYTNGMIETNVDNDPAATCGGCANNIEIDASLAAIVSGGSSGMQTPGTSAINNWTNVGGRIENTTHSVNISQETVLYDQRFSNGVAPPWFPSTTWTVSGVDTASYPAPTIQPTQWIDETAVNTSN